MVDSHLVSNDGERPQGMLRRLFPLNVLIFAGFMTISLPLPVLPLYASSTMASGPATIGFLIGLQSIVTVLTRPYAGRFADTNGARQTTILGLWICAGSGILYLIGALAPRGLLFLLAGRATLGLGESLILTGAITWGIGRVGARNSGLVMSWNGLAMYAALAAGAPLGFAVYLASDNPHMGFLGLGVVATAFPLLALAIALRIPSTPTIKGTHIPLGPLLKAIWPYGLSLTLLMASYGSIAAFYTLHFDEMAWQSAGIGFAAFGAAVILVRVLFGGLPDRIGGGRVALTSMLVACVGQIAIWLSPSPSVAVLGAFLTGAGVALGFPALGVEAMKRVPASNRGMMIAVFSAFQDLAFGLTGPIAGMLIVAFGTSTSIAFFLGSATTLLAIILLMYQQRLTQNESHTDLPSTGL